MRDRPRGAQQGRARDYVSLLFALEGRKVLLTFCLIAAGALLESLSLVLLVPLLKLVGVNLGGGTASHIAQLAQTLLATFGLNGSLLAVLAAYVTVVSARAVIQCRQSIAVADLESSFVRDVRHEMLHSILYTRWIFFSRTRASTFVHALTSEIGRVGRATDYLLPMLSQVLVVSVYLVFAFTLSPLITLVVFSAGAALLVAVRPKARKAFATGARMTVASRSLYAAVIEQLNGFKTARSYRAEERTVRLFDGLERDVLATQMETQRNFSLVKLLFEVGAVLILALMLYISVALVRLPLAEVLLLIYLFGRVVPRLSVVQQGYQYFVNALPAFREVMQVIEDCENEREPGSGHQPVKLKRGVRLRAVSFSYSPAANPPTVSDVDLDIPLHRTTAIVGPSGAGKTTVADLVLGLIAPTSGEVLLDDQSLGAENVAAWRDQIGYVPQDGFLFHDTIRANLLWARPNASEGDLREALAMASADGFVRRLPLGIDSVIGDRGVLLSGGERQRLALARALLREPTMLILDEATSSLDSENERQIQRAIEQLHHRTTILVITHRLSTIREADAIHVMEEGRLVESGSWSELMRVNGRFVDLCRAQRITVGPAGEPLTAGPGNR